MGDLTRDDFVRRLRALGIKQEAFAKATNYAPPTVYCWGRSTEFPAFVDLLLTAWERVAELEAEARGE